MNILHKIVKKVRNNERLESGECISYKKVVSDISPFK